jgi:ferritin-like metal-binding protein YciE
VSARTLRRRPRSAPLRASPGGTQFATRFLRVRREAQGTSAHESTARETAMKMRTLQDLLVHEIKDLYSAEKQLLKVLPKMAKAATHAELKQGFETHLGETEEQVNRLERIMETMEIPTRVPKCKAMEGLIEEGQDILNEEMEDDVRDAALISSAQRVEHYEIAGYGCARTFAEQLGHEEAARMLQETLDEEKATDEKLTQIAMQGVNLEAAHA